MLVGTCGFPVARRKYFEQFKVVEIQKTFYTPISPELARKWRKEAPPDFEYTLKAPQTITHESNSPTYRRYRGPKGRFGRFRVNEDTMKSWEKFVEVAKILRAKIVIFQSPPSFSEKKENVDNIINFFSTIEKDFIYGWEPRGKWRDETIKKICRDLDLIHVVDPFLSKKLHGSVSYFRLHGKGSYRYRFTDDDFIYLRRITREGDYVMFNNVHMWEDALRFKKFEGDSS